MGPLLQLTLLSFFMRLEIGLTIPEGNARSPAEAPVTTVLALTPCVILARGTTSPLSRPQGFYVQERH